MTLYLINFQQGRYKEAHKAWFRITMEPQDGSEPPIFVERTILDSKLALARDPEELTRTLKVDLAKGLAEHIVDKVVR